MLDSGDKYLGLQAAFYFTYKDPLPFLAIFWSKEKVQGYLRKRLVANLKKYTNHGN